MSKLLSSSTYDIGSFYYEDGLVKEFQFNFQDLSDFHYIGLGCGSCTDITSIDKEKGTIKGLINITSAIGDLKKSVGEHPVTKYLSVKFDPSTHEFVADDKGKKVYNSAANVVHLTVKFLVRVVAPHNL